MRGIAREGEYQARIRDRDEAHTPSLLPERVGGHGHNGPRLVSVLLACKLAKGCNPSAGDFDILVVLWQIALQDSHRDRKRSSKNAHLGA